MESLDTDHRHYSPALALTLLDPKLDFSEGETSAGIDAGTVVGRADGSGISPHDLRRLQVRAKQRVSLYYCAVCPASSVLLCCVPSKLSESRI